MVASSRGLGHMVFIHAIAGSNPAATTIEQKKTHGVLFCSIDVTTKDTNPQGSLVVGAEQESRIYSRFFEATPHELICASAQIKLAAEITKHKKKSFQDLFLCFLVTR